MKTALARTAGWIASLTLVFDCVIWAAVPSVSSLSTLTTVLWLFGAAGGLCLLLRRLINLEDRTRELIAQLGRERGARQVAEGLLVDTQTVLSKVVRQQETARDGERDRIARDIREDLGQTLLSLRIELSLLQVATNGIHPAVHQKAGAMVKTLDLALHSLRVVVEGLRPLAAGENLHGAMERQLDEFTRLNGIGHTFDAGPGACEDAQAGTELDAVLYRVLQEALANVARRATATDVRVSVQRIGQQLLMRVDDNGALEAAPAACSCGVAGMRTRIEALGGVLRIGGGPGGTTVALSVPVPHAMAVS
jgi:signal transduction histidine kinase